ncbi:MAG TPA: acetolactate synthase large subunit [Nitrososphaeraceae archaeon]|nr:acetolactate synthase large subunit [Nitrososphaeraceae archaeon]
MDNWVMKTSDLLVKCLEVEGVNYIFGLPGEETADLMISLLNSSAKFILTRHEQSAAFMADVYGRLTGRVGVCLATLGPGATNLTTGIASANMDRSRVLAITGQIDSNMLHKESHQNMDVITMFKPITKWNQSIRNGDNIPEIVRRAFKIAMEEKAGATHIELPQDVAKQQSRIKPIGRQEEDVLLRSHPNRDLIVKAVKLILQAEKPLVLVGNGCIRGNASFHVRKFVEKTGISSVNTFMAKGVISDRWERHLRTIGIKDADHALIAMKEADLVIAIGYDLVEYSPRFWNDDLTKKIIHIDFTPAEVDTYYPPDVEIAADIELAINAILTALERETRFKNTTVNYFVCSDVPETFKRIKKEIDERVQRYADDLGYPIKPERMIADVRRALDDRDIVISDVGAHKLWIAKIYDTYYPNTCIISNGFASMGFALPGAIAAQLAFPERKVVAMCGDGGFLMNVQELETAVRLRLPIIIVIWCDKEFGVISLKQIEEFGKKAFTEFNNPDFVKLASSFGAIGYAVGSVNEFPNCLKKAKESKDIPVVISADVDYSRNKILLDDNYLG